MERVGCGQSAPQRSYLDQKDLPTSLPETRSRVLVTGGASGIGKATAELLGARGYAVGLLDRDGDRLAAVLAALSAAGVEAAGAAAVLGAGAWGLRPRILDIRFPNTLMALP